MGKTTADKIRFTKLRIEKLPFADKGKQVDYWDAELAGFGCRCSATARTYFVMKRVNGKLTRVALGKHGVISADTARRKAIKAIAELGDGIDLNAERAKARVKGICLEKAADLYLEERDIKDSTKAFYRMMVDVHLKPWKQKPLREISDEMVKSLHKRLSASIGKVTANNAMKAFRTIYNYAKIEAKGDLPENPVKILSAKKSWHRVEKRKTRIQDYDLAVWYQAVESLGNPVISDFFEFALFNGLRKNEALKLQWRHVDFKGKTFTIIDPKNGKDHTLPFTDFTESLLLRRYDQRWNGYVFPGTGKAGHLVEPRKQLKVIERETCKILNSIADDKELAQRLKQAPDSVVPGVVFMPHDLRRTFANVAEKLVSYSALKAMLNHTPQKSDVTADYLDITVEELRGPLQEVADALMEKTHAWFRWEPAEPTNNVIDLQERRERKVAA
jgi:integrase